MEFMSKEIDEQLFFRKDETTPYAIKSGVSFNSLLRRKWKVL